MKKISLMAITLLLVVMMSIIAYASDNKDERFKENQHNNPNGYYSDTDKFVWTFNDTGKSVEFGRGGSYMSSHPECTDDEYLLRRFVLYSGEPEGSLGQPGMPKNKYTEGTLPILQGFVHSFDWRNSDELTRAQKVYEYCACNHNGNYYKVGNNADVSFRVLETKSGICTDFAQAFEVLAKSVGLDVMQYEPNYLKPHRSVMVKINGQWYAIDPTVGAGFFDPNNFFPCDMETERDRLATELAASEEYQKSKESNALLERYEKGEITYEDYIRKSGEVYGKTSEAIEKEVAEWKASQAMTKEDWENLFPGLNLKN